MTNDLRVVGRCISIWHSRRVNQEKNPYSLDFVRRDNDAINTRISITQHIAKFIYFPTLWEIYFSIQSNHIQVYIRKELGCVWYPFLGINYHYESVQIQTSYCQRAILPNI